LRWRWNCTSTQNTYALRSTSPSVRAGWPNTSRFHAAGTTAESISIAARTASPSTLAPDSITSVRIFTNADTIA